MDPLQPGLDFRSDYDVVMPRPSSVRFRSDIEARLRAFLAANPALSVSAAVNLLVDEGLRMRDHPAIIFRDGPTGRRPRLVDGPDVAGLIGAIRSARAAEPTFAEDEVVELVAETSGVSAEDVQAAIDYWSAYRDEVDALVANAEHVATEAELAGRNRRELLAQ